MPTHEYAVRPVTRYVVTRYTKIFPHESIEMVMAGNIGVQQIGEFAKEEFAESVANAFIEADVAAGKDSKRYYPNKSA